MNKRDEARLMALATLAVNDRPSSRMLRFDGGGLQPGVDLDDSADLLDLMDGPGATR